MVTENAVFDTEPNGTTDTAIRDLTDARSAVGNVRPGFASLADPEDDLFQGATGRQFDILEVGGIIQDGALQFSVTVSEPIGAGPILVFGEIDLDQDPDTGNPSIVSELGTPAGYPGAPLGAEVLFQGFLSNDFREVTIFDGDLSTGQPTILGMVTGEIDGDTVNIEIPIEFLGADVRELNLATIVGGPQGEINDVAPNNQVVTISRGGGDQSSSVDEYSVNLNQGEETRFQLELPGIVSDGLTRATLQILDPSGSVVSAESTGELPSAGIRVSVTPNTTGPYRVRVVAEEGSVDYVLTAVNSIPGDANHDGRFDQLDLVRVLQSAKYLTGQRATWEEGDWNGDNVFDQFDLVLALANWSISDQRAALDNAMARKDGWYGSKNNVES